jgi:membrane-bound lytic murein transglycosylase D
MAAAIGSEYRVLKELNPHILRHQLPTGTYTIKVPQGSQSRLAAVLQQLDNKASGEVAEVSPNHYVVQAGDTLSHIAVRTGISVTTLKRLNNIQGSLLRVGQTLQLAP